MIPPVLRGALGALGAHRFLMRSALAATTLFAWTFAFQYLYGVFGNLPEAFVRVVLLYELSQVITNLLTPYAAKQLARGVRGRMVIGVLTCVLALVIFGAALSGVINGLAGLVSFAVFMGAYRALYWTPYVLEKRNDAAA